MTATLKKPFLEFEEILNVKIDKIQGKQIISLFCHNKVTKIKKTSFVMSLLLASLAVNFTNISRAACVPMSLHQKSTKLKCKYKKAAQKTFV